MGGDHAPEEIVKGALLAVSEYPVKVLLVGREEVVRKELAKADSQRNIEVVDAREVVEMDDTALAPLRRKRNSSVRVCANLVAEGRADAFVSAGNTGATWTSARAVMGMIEGVSRPALAAILPNANDHTLLLDVGANVDAKPNHLREFAVMGHFYAQMVFGIEAPRVGLLSIGEEEGKGNALVDAATPLLAKAPIDFKGNVEGGDMLLGDVDVIVCDGFVGNVALKLAEGAGEYVFGALRAASTSSLAARIGSALLRPKLREIKNRMDYREYGGAPVLGLRGNCFIGHGRTDAKAVASACQSALRAVQQDLVGAIGRAIAAGDAAGDPAEAMI